MPVLLPLIYPQEWLDLPAIQFGQPEKTYYEFFSAEIPKRLRFERRQTGLGALSQLAASATHKVSSDRLAALARSIPKVLILTGDQDHLVAPRNSVWLKKCMPEAEFVEWKGTGRLTLSVPVSGAKEGAI